MQIRWVALIVSWVVDIGGSSVLGLVLFSFLFATGQLPMAIANDQRALTAALAARPDWYAVTLVGGLFFSILAGYIAARLAGRALLLHGLLSSVACLASDLTSLDLLAQLPLWVVALGVALSPAAGVLGGYVRQLQTRGAQLLAA